MRVLILETDVFGAKAYHYKCCECGKQCKRKDKEAQAVALAKKHKCKGKK